MSGRDMRVILETVGKTVESEPIYEKEPSQPNREKSKLSPIDPDLRSPFLTKHKNKPTKKKGNVLRLIPSTAIDAWQRFENNETQGFIIRIAGEQVMSMFKVGDEFKYALQQSSLNDLVPNSRLVELINNLKLDVQGDLDRRTAVAVIRYIMRAAKNESLAYDAIIVQSQAREHAPDKSKFFETVKLAIKRRLDRYKQNKSNIYASLEQYIRGLETSGLLKKINVAGNVYELVDFKLTSDSLKDPTTNIEKSYLEYQAQKESPNKPKTIKAYIVYQNNELIPTEIEIKN